MNEVQIISIKCFVSGQDVTVALEVALRRFEELRDDDDDDDDEDNDDDGGGDVDVADNEMDDESESDGDECDDDD